MRLIRLTKQDKARIQQILKRYLDREEVQSMQRFVQHGRTSTYAHSVNVVKLSYWLNKKFHLNADERALLTELCYMIFIFMTGMRKATGINGTVFHIRSGQQEMRTGFFTSEKESGRLSRAICGR